MDTITDVTALRQVLQSHRRDGARIGFVPTMGNLHAGHYSLIERARQQSDFVVASVFVNPTQFGPAEDFSRYPRTPEADAAGLAAAGCRALFLPDVATLYPFGAEASVTVHVPIVSEPLEGELRPGHFDGVATVVARLFNLVRPDVAIFGRKDYQQLLVIRRMVADLGFAIDIVGAPIVREANGLAMSSRNQYLTPAQRQQAAEIHATLVEMERHWLTGKAAIATIEADALSHLRDKGFMVDYATVRNGDDLGPALEAPDTPKVALIAARLGSTRLIDNREFKNGS